MRTKADATARKTSKGKTRIERDPLGERPVPADALYGVQTLRARENFQLGARRIHPAFITAYAEIKRAAAEANVATGKLDRKIGRAIIEAADEIIAGRWRDQFDLDVFQAAATLEEKCIRDIKAHPDICRRFAERSVGQAARLNEERGFMVFQFSRRVSRGSNSLPQRSRRRRPRQEVDAAAEQLFDRTLRTEPLFRPSFIR